MTYNILTSELSTADQKIYEILNEEKVFFSSLIDKEYICRESTIQVFDILFLFLAKAHSRKLLSSFTQNVTLNRSHLSSPT